MAQKRSKIWPETENGPVAVEEASKAAPQSCIGQKPWPPSKLLKQAAARTQGYHCDFED